MKTIVILHKDVCNIPTYHIVKEMMKRGYYIDFFAFFFERIHLRMFDDLNIQIHDIEELKFVDLDEYDFIFSSVSIDAIPNIMQARKYIFVFSTTFMDETSSYGDYTFTQRDLSNHLQNYEYSVERNNEKKCSPGKALGNPKFDIEENDQQEIVNERQILFVEASHYPYGKNGKMEETKMLLNICQKCSNYQVVVKPRFFPEDKNVTHKNGIHLYQCIDELTDGFLPDNLVLLYKHMDLEKLVRQSGIVVMTEMTTSYLDIGTYKKHGIIASNLPSESTFVHNENHVRRFRNIQARSGLCVDYKNVIDYLPEGLVCKKEHIVEMGIDKKMISQNIVDEMERIYINYLSFDRYPSPDVSSKTITMDEVISYRYLKHMYGILDSLKEVIENLDFIKAEQYIEDLWNGENVINEENHRKYENDLLSIRQDIMMNSRELFMKDAISQNYYLRLLYDVDKIQDENVELYEDQAKAMYYCLMGKYKAIKEKQYKEAIDCFRKYFFAIKNNHFEKTLADTSYYKESASYWTGVCYYELFNFKEAEKYFLKCQELTGSKHRKAKEYLRRINYNI